MHFFFMLRVKWRHVFRWTHHSRFASCRPPIPSPWISPHNPREWSNAGLWSLPHSQALGPHRSTLCCRVNTLIPFHNISDKVLQQLKKTNKALQTSEISLRKSVSCPQTCVFILTNWSHRVERPIPQIFFTSGQVVYVYSVFLKSWNSSGRNESNSFPQLECGSRVWPHRELTWVNHNL